jgi:hypothetical protein
MFMHQTKSGESQGKQLETDGDPSPNSRQLVETHRKAGTFSSISVSKKKIVTATA